MSSAGRNPQRTCLGCRGSFDQDTLVRFVVSPQGELLADYRGRLPGRGAYTCLSGKCIRDAVKRRQFERAFKVPVRVPAADELVAALGGQVRERVWNLLGMARKSGGVVSGSSAVLAELGHAGKLALVLMACDISEAMAGKVKSKANAAGLPVWRLFDKDLFGQILGKGERSVVALRPGKLAESIRHELLRFEHIAGEN
ncbi:50S ribosomal protein L7/L12 [Desulfuromonas versatilis]|uniref:50S ribosomal protein L7/L12 n=1 Tax=Desulfuromonas versatilis TaxID=2802975 RepID=A0ABN6E100_9BACT|nr:DUF448 domain-containing protein [Desulfuromonas versatilis]BCR04826.1 50S ribosomal protein L7/L12 [Desulfuromonas versatilis]